MIKVSCQEMKQIPEILVYIINHRDLKVLYKMS